VLDVLIRNGRLIDGTGNPWVRADVGIFVCPGFVDMHAHSDVQLLASATQSLERRSA
jgi:N-acyl-D-amino-acid deacylase